MSPLIRDGVYKIRNCEYDDYVAELLRGIPRGPIVAIRAQASNRHDKWVITNVGSGGNQVIIENLSRRGTYADPEQRGGGGSLVGSHEQTVWTIVKVDSGMYYLQSEDGECVWQLPRGADYQNIMLIPHNGQKDTKWVFERARA